MTSSNCYQLAILETSDLHCSILPYDYYSDKKSDFFGLAKTASLIKKYRKLFPHSLLVDNGDLIQGNALSDYLKQFKVIDSKTIHPIIDVMNFLEYDIATVGNHDFNYGIEFLKKVTNQANFPYINSNIFLKNPKNKNLKGESLFPKSFIIEKKFNANDKIKIGFLGMAPPQILIWDKHVLDNKIIIDDIVEAATKTAKELKKSGADIVIALAHSGILPVKYIKNSENAVYKLSKIKEIDAIFSGHAHNIFPGGKVYDQKEKFKIDNVTGKINNKPVVMPGALGSHLGVIIFKLEKLKKSWKIKETFTELPNVRNVEEDSKIVSLVAKHNVKVLEYIRAKVGKTQIHFHSWFSTIECSYASQFIQKIAIEYVKNKLTETKWKNLPIICSFAPLNTGSHGSAYINISKGDLAIKDICNLYPYDNEIKVLLINKTQIKEWLEFACQAFQQIKSSDLDEINIINPLFPSFNFDCIYGLTYEIDLTQPIGSRIINLLYQGKEIKKFQKFAIITNNYRAAGGGNFPNVTKLKIIYDTTKLYRDIIINKVKNIKEINFELEQNWKIKQLQSTVKQKIFFESSLDSIPFHPKYLIPYTKDLNNKRVKYLVDMTKI
ncbi:bifunctional 2',3'-cyclic-nucleotide 2'-phosphodiesterase/3'-nucleotidase [Pigmentibacter sp. JX0631]|uniref:bifunctional 2',3'-cyclic-nucleotide 2'-phosphodiesterase/3'-nucleotidase n=1 Tax=Pigmentibacter sp. JX0631 TaxID=2976982 RepID=UPI0024682B74|nr:bifunctional 2',3'-cyclic-nucleotide 2'-phosphodiesterase/3'-nucleotidase [Pigmentibacter sp. JX0631]WGL60661.1 bifunctional 2',3'-cyclic-nucleotide 2'-phosphodiesterase/3'-nucleotidase [Pigmentibacter sp. JX0631]